MRLLPLWLVLLGFFAPAGGEQPAVVAVDFDTVIHPITVDVLTHAIEQAQRDRAPFVLIRLNTPGGMLGATQTLVERINASPVPVVTFVTPSGGRAASAGFILLLAGDVAAMATGTHTGAASPVLLGQEMDATMRHKIENDTAAAVRSLAARHNRDAAAAQATVFEAKSYTSEEAANLRLADLVVRDQQDLLNRLNGREITRPNGSISVLHTSGVAVVDYSPSLRERAVLMVADPNLALIMLVLGGLLLYVEFNAPGMVAPGAAGAILLLVGLLALSVLPIRGAAVGLLVLALALFIMEAKVGAHGVLAAGGAVAMLFGSLLLVEGPPEMRIRLSTALSVTVPFALITAFLVTLVVRARLRPAVTGAAGLLSETGLAHTDLAPEGVVRVHGEFWKAIAAAPIPRGTPVRVSAVDGLCLKVERLGTDSQTPEFRKV
jgi:membrane-bound serine protease (ClpP class)